MDIYEQLRRHEGVRYKVYNDSLGIPTIGVGRNLRDNGLSDNEVNYLLANDVSKVQSALRQFSWFNSLSDCRQAVFIDMAFNMGVEGLLHFHETITLVTQGHYGQASVSMLQSLWAQQVGERATELSEQLKINEWQSGS